MQGTNSLSVRLGTSFGVWRSLVARFVRDEEAVGSNPATPTSGRGPMNTSAPDSVVLVRMAEAGVAR